MASHIEGRTQVEGERKNGAEKDISLLKINMCSVVIGKATRERRFGKQVYE
jgi:hypothetical protein